MNEYKILLEVLCFLGSFFPSFIFAVAWVSYLYIVLKGSDV